MGAKKPGWEAKSIALREAVKKSKAKSPKAADAYVPPHILD